MRVIRRSSSIRELPRAARLLMATPHVCSRWLPFRGSSPAATGVCVALLSLVWGCERDYLSLGRHTTDPSEPTSATFQLAPGAPTSAQEAPGPADNVLATTAPDATPPSSAAAAPGTVSATCVNGWSTPERGSALRGVALDMMRVRPGERFVVEEMRYFVGPEDAEVLGARGDVERWYVKASTETEPRRRQRWIVMRRAKGGSGIDAIAPYDSTGYGPGIWRRPDARDPALADPFERPCQGTKPGAKCMGLPREVLGCLAGT
jgi:hypothetical protein